MSSKWQLIMTMIFKRLLHGATRNAVSDGNMRPTLETQVNTVLREPDARLAQSMRRTLIEPEDTRSMSDVTLLAYYGRTLLKLRSIYLPDPGPA